MARTRTQTGVIEKKKYGIESIRLHGVKSSTSSGSGQNPKKGGRTGGIKKGPKKGGRKKPSSETVEEEPVVALTDVDHEPTPQPDPGRPDITDGNHWWPSVVLGEREKEGLR